MMKKIIAILLSAIMAVSLLAACGASGSSPSDSSIFGMTGSGGSYAEIAPAAPPMPSPSASFDFSLRNSSGGSYEYDAAYEADYDDGGWRLQAEMETQGSSAGTAANNASPPADTLPDTSGGMAEKIIYSAYADIETVEFDEAVERVYELLRVNNAFVESSYIGGRNYSQSYYGYQSYRSANFTLRIPKERFEAVTANLSVLGNVTSLRTDAQNITAQFFDTESRLSSFRVLEGRLLDMLEKADNVADMISIESSLAEIHYSIESLTSTLRNWQGQVDYSTLTVYIHEVERLTEIVPIQRTYWQRVGDGLQSRTRDVGVFFTSLFMWVVVNLPVFAVLAVVAVAAVIIVKKKLKIKLKKKAAQEDEEQ